jgi:hypothetical protein
MNLIVKLKDEVVIIILGIILTKHSRSRYKAVIMLEGVIVS